jgi:hypothetical protein
LRISWYAQLYRYLRRLGRWLDSAIPPPVNSQQITGIPERFAVKEHGKK